MSVFYKKLPLPLEVILNCIYFIINLKFLLFSKKLDFILKYIYIIYLYSLYKLIKIPTYPIHPINANNARYSCITAAAGTCIGHNFSLFTITLF